MRKWFVVITMSDIIIINWRPESNFPVFIGVVFWLVNCQGVQLVFCVYKLVCNITEKTHWWIIKDDVLKITIACFSAFYCSYVTFCFNWNLRLSGIAQPVIIAITQDLTVMFFCAYKTTIGPMYFSEHSSIQPSDLREKISGTFLLILRSR